MVENKKDLFDVEIDYKKQTIKYTAFLPINTESLNNISAFHINNFGALFSSFLAMCTGLKYFGEEHWKKIIDKHFGGTNV